MSDMKITVTATGSLKVEGEVPLFDNDGNRLETREGKPYLRITESRKGEGDRFERNSINVFPEDADEFMEHLSKMVSKLNR